MDFNAITNRRGTNCYKWDSDDTDDILPLWVADMDFPTAEPIRRVLTDRVAHGVFGYSSVPHSFYDAICRWYARRNNWHIDAEWILYTSGVVPAVSAIIKALCPTSVSVPQPAVVVQTPVYNCFFSSIRNNGCRIVESPLIRVADTYEVDYDAFEEAVSREDVRLFLLCNPHNPAGRVWRPDELRRMGDICRRHGVTVVADEIHHGIIMPGHVYTPFASLGKEYLENSITASSPSKSFNTAGLQISYIIASDSDIRRRIDHAININEVCDVNPFGVIALQTAYNECEEWLSELCSYIHQNYLFLCDFFASRIPEAKVIRLEGTYLAWIDCRHTNLTSDNLCNRLIEEGHVRVSPGSIYGERDCYIRINMGCPQTVLAEGLRRIASVMASESR